MIIDYYSSPSSMTLLSILSVSAISCVSASLHTINLPFLFDEFRKWQKSWNVTYPSKSVERTRMNVWVDNKRHVDAHNAKNKPWKMAVNKFADQTNFEFKTKVNGLNRVIYPRPATKYPPLHAKSVRLAKICRLEGARNRKSYQEPGAVRVVLGIFSDRVFGGSVCTQTQEFDLIFRAGFGRLRAQGVQVSGGECCDGCGGAVSWMLRLITLLHLRRAQTTWRASTRTLRWTDECSFAADGPGLGDVTGHVDLTQGCDHSLQSAVATVGVISVGVDG